MKINNDASSKESCVCKRCGRSLNDAHSRLVGYGPTCYVKLKKELHRRNSLFSIKGDSNSEKN
jgi:hypothetical protein